MSASSLRPNRKAGILALVHKSFVPGNAIRSHARIPSRLMLLRLETDPAVCVIATYQHVWSDASGASTCEAKG